MLPRAAGVTLFPTGACCRLPDSEASQTLSFKPCSLLPLIFKLSWELEPLPFKLNGQLASFRVKHMVS